MLLKQLVITIAGVLTIGSTSLKKYTLLDGNKLAIHYFQNDANWYLENIPFFECSDQQIQDVYYYRWKLYKAHIRSVGEEYKYIVTEYLDHVGWDREPYNSINSASGLHIQEGRWLKDSRYLDGYIDYLNRGEGNDRFSESVVYSTYLRYLVNGDSSFVVRQLPYMIARYKQWSDLYDSSKKLYHIYPVNDVGEFDIAFVDASGWKQGDTVKGWEWGETYRPTFNSFQYANATAISHIAEMKGDTSMSRLYRETAAGLKETIQQSLWNDTLEHFMDRYRQDNQNVHYWDFIRNRDLSGYFPWQFNLPDNIEKYNVAWKHLMDTTKFLGRYGLRTNERLYPNYMCNVRLESGKPECMINGACWPYHSAPAIGGMINLLNNYNQNYIEASDYLKLIRQYTALHYYSAGAWNETGTPNGELNLVESYDPDTGKPIVDRYRSSHYLHSSYNDLVITGLCGIRPSKGNTLTINPLVDSSINYFCLHGVLYHGHNLTLVYDADGSKYQLGKGLTVFVDGKKASLKEKQGKYEVEIGKLVVINAPAEPENLALNILYKGYPKPSASVNSIPDSLFKAVDGRIWYFPEISNRWTTLGSTSETDWYAIDFGKAQTVSSVKLYLYADRKTYGVPDDFTVEYLKDGQWLPVKVKEQIPKKLVGNTVNTVFFDQILTAQLRVSFKHGAIPVALAELECY